MSIELVLLLCILQFVCSVSIEGFEWFEFYIVSVVFVMFGSVVFQDELFVFNILSVVKSERERERGDEYCLMV